MYPEVVIIGVEARSHWHRILIDSLLSAGFKDVSVLRAVDWRDLPESAPWQVGSLPPVYPYPGWCATHTRAAMTLGEVGCSLSHISAWHRIVETDRPALILEDDAVLLNDFASSIPSLMQDLAHVDYSVCYLYHSHYHPDDESKFRPLAGRLIHSIVDYYPVGAIAYIMSPSGARTVLSSPWDKYLIPADVIIPASFAIYDDPPLNHLYAGVDATPQSRGHVVSTLQNFFSFRDDSKFVSETMQSPTILEPERKSFLALSFALEETADIVRLKRTARRYGFSFEVLGLGESADGADADGAWRVHCLRSRLADVPPDTGVLFVDGSGVVVNGYVNDIIYLWRHSLGGKVVFSASRFLFDDSYMELYPSSDTPYRFLNSALFMGTAEDLRFILSAEISDGVDAQRYYTELFLGLRDGDGNGSDVISDKIILDRHCILFQSLHDALGDIVSYEYQSRLYNQRMETWPHLVHAGGATERDWLEKEGKFVGACHLVPL